MSEKTETAGFGTDEYDFGSAARSSPTPPPSPATPTLAPCPFCGGKAEFERLGNARCSAIVICTDCGCRHESSNTYENSAAGWNRRAERTPVAAEGLPAVLFDGYSVLRAMTDQARARTSGDNVSDVLDAVVKLMRASTPAAKGMETGEAS